MGGWAGVCASGLPAQHVLCPVRQTAMRPFGRVLSCPALLAGIFTVAWQLPLDPRAVRRAQREQAALQPRTGAGLSALHVGRRLQVHWEQEQEWYPGSIQSVDNR